MVWQQVLFQLSQTLSAAENTWSRLFARVFFHHRHIATQSGLFGTWCDAKIKEGTPEMTLLWQSACFDGHWKPIAPEEPDSQTSAHDRLQSSFIRQHVLPANYALLAKPEELASMGNVKAPTTIMLRGSALQKMSSLDTKHWKYASLMLCPFLIMAV